MARKRNALLSFIIILLFLAIACSISYSPNKTSQSESGSGQPSSEQVQPESKESGPVVAIPSTPVGLNKGLASLDSYTFMFQVITNGPTSQDKSESLITNSYGSNGDFIKIHVESISSTESDPEESRYSMTNYRIGNKSCTVDEIGGGDPQIDNYTSSQKEMSSVFMNLFDTSINVSNPVFIGVETISGISCNHFSFNVSGLGTISGAVVSQSSGEYWSAVDGNYLVKYDVVLETRNAPENNTNAEVMHSEAHFLLSDINAVVTTAMPAECS